jgi:hypothetical protein
MGKFVNVIKTLVIYPVLHLSSLRPFDCACWDGLHTAAFWVFGISMNIEISLNWKMATSPTKSGDETISKVGDYELKYV